MQSNYVTPAHEQSHGWPKRIIFGVDEAGRGPWAGPVVAAAVYLPADYAQIGLGALGELNDSKKMSEKQRAVLFQTLQSVPHGIGAASVEEIDQLNILQASLLAMKRAVKLCPLEPAHVLVDGNKLPDWSHAATCLIKGDAISPSIAAASILAKVTRDRLMVALDAQFPGYDWARNKGYGVKAHQRGLALLGVTSHHRQSFAPIRKLLSS